MNSTASLQNTTSTLEQRYRDQYRAKVKEYMTNQPAIVRGLHYALQVVFMLAIVLAAIFFVVALYYTFVWMFTGALTKLDDAWIDYGLSMSFLAFPLGLDSMLTRVFPSTVFPAAYYRSAKPIPFMTGISAFIAGFGIACAGAPGAVHMFDLASQAIQNLF
jgi:hypothetical protein